MAFSMLPQIIIIFSIGIIVAILSKNISKLKDLENEDLFDEKEEESKEKKIFLYLYARLKKRINRKEYNKMINSWWIWLEKTLRKVRINFLKIDNKIISILDKLREKKSEIDIDKKNEIDSMDKYEGFEEEKNVNEIDDEKQKQKKVDVIKQDTTEEQNLPQSEISDQPCLTEKIDLDSQKDEIEEIEISTIKNDAKGKEKEYIEAIMKNPIDIKLYWKLGIVYSRRKNYKDAISCFKQIAKIDPKYIKAKKKISDLIERMKNKEQEKKLSSESNDDFMKEEVDE